MEKAGLTTQASFEVLKAANTYIKLTTHLLSFLRFDTWLNKHVMSMSLCRLEFP